MSSMAAVTLGLKVIVVHWWCTSLHNSVFSESCGKCVISQGGRIYTMEIIKHSKWSSSPSEPVFQHLAAHHCPKWNLKFKESSPEENNVVFLLNKTASVNLLKYKPSLWLLCLETLHGSPFHWEEKSHCDLRTPCALTALGPSFLIYTSLLLFLPPDPASVLGSFL